MGDLGAGGGAVDLEDLAGAGEARNAYWSIGRLRNSLAGFYFDGGAGVLAGRADCWEGYWKLE